MSKKAKVFTNSFLYSFNSLLLKAVNFLLIPVYTAFLTTADYGTTNLASNFNTVATCFVAFSLYTSVIRFYVDLKENSEALKRFYGTLVLFIGGSSVVFLMFSLLLKDWIIRILFDGIDFYPTILIVLLNIPFSCMHSLYQNILQGRQEGKKYTVTSIFYFSFMVSLNMIFVVGMKMGANGVLLSTLIVNILFAIFVIFDLKRLNLIRFCIDFKLLKSALKYSVPLMPHDLSAYTAPLISKIILNKSFALSSVGLYGLATQLSSVTDMVQMSVNMAFAPWFYEKLKQNTPQAKEEVVKTAQPLMWVYGIIFLAVGLFSQEVILIMAQDSYALAWKVVPLLVVALSIKSIYYFYVNVLFYYKSAAKKIFIATMSGSIVNIVASFLLIPVYDIYGAGIAQIVSRLVTVSIVVIISRRVDNVGFKLHKMVGMVVLNILFITGGLYFSYTRFDTQFSLINFGYKMIFFAAYTGIACFAMKKDIKALFENIKLNYIK
ncbi:MAG TPA: oligosaccharide flippase family protein [Clostridia bacterium]|nr:oligosaccharide flippase family protein [Clostridia bacterium]